MVRTQIQLTETQAKILRELAAKKGVSMAELVRQSVDNYLQTNQPDKYTLAERAKEAAGRFNVNTKDLARHHDHYLAEDLGK